MSETVALVVGVGPGLGSDAARLQCHAALRARTGMISDHIRMHGAHIVEAFLEQWRLFRLQRHAALGARTGSGLLDLRVHRADVNRTGCRKGLLFGLRLQESRRIGGKSFQASPAAEKIVSSLVGVAVRGGLGIDPHAANRVAGAVGPIML